MLLGNGGGGVPGVDIGLGEVARGWRPSGSPGKEVLGLDEPLLGVFAGAGPQGCGGGLGAHAGELVPEAELAQQPFVRVAGQAGEAAVHPAFVVGELPVGGREGAAAGEEVAQIDRRAPVGAGGQGLVGEWQAAGDQVGEQAADVGPGEPAGGRRRVGCGGEGLGEGTQGGGEVAGVPKISVMAWVTAQGWQSRPAGQVAFVVAVQAGEVAADAGAVTADRCLVGGAAAG